MYRKGSYTFTQQPQRHQTMGPKCKRRFDLELAFFRCALRVLGTQQPKGVTHSEQLCSVFSHLLSKQKKMKRLTTLSKSTSCTGDLKNNIY